VSCRRLGVQDTIRAFPSGLSKWCESLVTAINRIRRTPGPVEPLDQWYGCAGRNARADTVAFYSQMFNVPRACGRRGIAVGIVLNFSPRQSTRTR